MSLENLLHSETKDERWSALNCYSLNTTILDADNIVGNLDTNTNIIAPGDVSITPGFGTGNLNKVESCVSTWTANDSTRQFYRLDVTLLYDTDVTGVYVVPNSTFQVEVKVPDLASIIYPSSVGEVMPGAVSAYLIESPGVFRLASGYSNLHHITSPFDFAVNATVTGDISGVVATRILRLQFSITYRVN